MEKGEMFGEIEVLQARCYDCSVRCKSLEGEIYMVPVKEFEKRVLTSADSVAILDRSAATKAKLLAERIRMAQRLADETRPKLDAYLKEKVARVSPRHKHNMSLILPGTIHPGAVSPTESPTRLRQPLLGKLAETLLPTGNRDSLPQIKARNVRRSPQLRPRIPADRIRLSASPIDRYIHQTSTISPRKPREKLGLEFKMTRCDPNCTLG